MPPLTKRNSSEDTSTRELMARFETLRQRRRRFHLTLPELLEVAKWKLEGQYGRAARHLERLTPPIVRTVTAAAFAIDGPDDDFETELRAGLLTTLPGVGLPIASAVLTLVEPDRYAVIDFRAWRALFGSDRASFGVADYRAFMSALRERSVRERTTPRDVELRLWHEDKEARGRSAVGR
ncbi:MAG: hypothetical protein IPF53_16500 [Blastocatellia bacterium]|nr:hypothetical protein [Blastocatellia bacterium]MBK6427450.1 hypothetical protein [Blastocatellia bacterium]